MESKSNFNVQQVTLDTEGSLVDKLIFEMKQLLFKIVTLMLKNDSQSLVYQLILRLIQYMQLNAILFNRQVWRVWQVTKVSEPLHQFFSYFIFTPHFNSSDFSYFVVVMYICLSFFLISLMLFFIIGFYSNQQTQSFSWGIAVLKVQIEFFLTILFLPFIDVFLSMIACQIDSNGNFQHSLFDVECWANVHIVHGIVAIIALTIFFSVVIIFSVIYYELNYLPQKFNSKQQGMHQTLLLFYQFIMVICYTYMDNKLYEYLHVLIMLAGSFLVFWSIHVEKPYYNFIIQKSYSMLVTFNLWGVSMLCFAKYLEGVLFFGLIFCWLGGLPMLAITLFRPQKDQYDILMTNLATCQQPEQIYKMTNYLLQLQFESQSDQTSGLIIDGYLDHHRLTCVRSDCHMKIKSLPNYRNHKFNFKDTTMQERDIDIATVIYQIYLNQTKKFPNSIKLRLRFAVYMFEKMKSKQNSLSEFQAIEALFPKFDEEFIIYRFKKLIEDEMSHNDTFGSFDIGNELTYQNNYKQLQRNIERSTLLHMDFWSLLQEDFPDLSKLNEIGQKINNSISQIEDLWKKMTKQSQNMNIHKALRLYGKYLVEVLQDKEQGEDLLEKSRQVQLQANYNRNKAITQFLNQEDIGFESLPTIIIATTVDKFSQIVNLNKSCCNILAYNKSELINKKVTHIMPNVFAKFHDRYIEKFMQLNVSAFFNVDRYIFVKSKHNYITPSFLNIRMLQSFDDTALIVGQFKLIKSYRPICYILTDSEKIIESISSSCYILLGLDTKIIQHNKILITDLFPTFNEQLKSFITKQGNQVKYQNQLSMQTKTHSQQMTSEYQTEKQKSEKNPQTFQCNVSEIKDFDHQLVGYAIKLELLSSDKSMGTQQNNSLMIEKQTEQQALGYMQFKFHPKMMTYIVEQGNEANSQRVDQSIVWEQQDQSSMVTSNIGNDQYQKPSTEKSEDNFFSPTMKLDDGIRTLRLFDNKIQDIEEKDDVISDDDDSGKSSVFQKIDNESVEVGGNDNMNAFRSRTSLFQLINTQKTPLVITKLNWTMNLEILSIVTLSFVAFFLTSQQYNNITNQLDLVKEVSIRNAEFFNILAALQNLQMQNIGIWQFDSDDLSKKYESDQRKYINDTVNTISEINTFVAMSENQENSQLREMYTENIINIRISEGVFQKYDLTQAMEQLLSKALIIRDKPLKQMTLDDDDYKFLTYNLMNDFVLTLQNSTQQYTTILGQKTADNRQELMSILGASAGILGVSLLLLIFFLIQMASRLQDILVLFLDIPDKTIKFLYSKCENFLSNVQIGEEDEIISDFDELEKEEQEELNRTLKQRRKKKKFQNSNKELRNLILISLIITMLFQSYFIIFYFLSSNQLTNLNQIVQEINATSYCEGFYKVAEAAERHVFLNREIPLTGTDPYYLTKFIIDTLYQIDSEFHQEHSLNVNVLNQIYIDAFEEVFMLQPCDLFSTVMQSGTLDECTQFASGAIDQGMAVGIARFIESIRYLLTVYDQFYGHPEADFTTVVRGNVVFRNITQNDDNATNYIYNLNNFKQAKELRIMQSRYLKATFRYLFMKLSEGINDDLNNSKTQLLALFIVFEAIIFILYFLFWLPLTIKLTRDIWKTKIMVMMIPLKVMLRIRSIKTYIRDIILEKAVNK